MSTRYFREILAGPAILDRLDATSPLTDPSSEPLRRLGRVLDELYGDRGGEAFREIVEILRAHVSRTAEATPGRRTWTERDSVLITYPDQISAPGEAPLRTLNGFLRKRLEGLVTAVHVLPIFPATSDDGFAVQDYTAVDPRLGDWDDVSAIAGDHDVMLDLVLNHVSASHPWLQGFLADDPSYRDHFIEVRQDAELQGILRPRAHPLVTAFPARGGERSLWTTFSRDQVDLNYRNPRVLARMVDVMLTYVSRGAALLRLDAVGYTWKELGTTCFNLPGAHRLVRVFRAALDAVAPSVALVSETNASYADNVSYFGDGTDEAQVVYQFTLPPLVVHAIHTGDAGRLSSWLGAMERPPDGCTFLNFVGSHDGIGLMPAEGFLSDEEVDALADRIIRHGGLVSQRDTPRGPRPYELNSTLFGALSDPAAGEPESLQVSRFLAANAVMLMLAGIPGIYVHSLFGSANDGAAAQETGIARRINRARFDAAGLESVLANEGSRARRVFDGFSALLRARAAHPAFRPDAPQRVVEASPGVLAVERGSEETGRVLCAVNLAASPGWVGSPRPASDLLSGRPAGAGERIDLGTYQCAWLAEPTRTSVGMDRPEPARDGRVP
ncbi:MAG: sugar phosphorylase [Actinomycetota bacterium]